MTPSSDAMSSAAAPSFRPDEFPAVTDAAVGPKRRLQLAERIERRVGTKELILLEPLRIALLLRDLDRRDLDSKRPRARAPSAAFCCDRIANAS